jgi:hypothetical protein
MARDLIPPESPAGRPVPGAPRFIELPPEQPQAEAEVAEGPRRPSAYRNRFGFLLGALAGVVVAVAAIVLIAVTKGDPAVSEGLAKHFSKWEPAEKSIDGGASQIAQHVGAQYKLGNGSQLVMVKGAPLQVLDPDVKVALRPSPGNIATMPADHAVLYTLNGLGPAGSMQGGKPSKARHQLLRREALELALYTFRYLKGVDMVVTLLPPIFANGSGPTASTTASDVDQQAVFYRPGDLRQQLQVPLGLTVPAKTPNPDTMGGADGRRVDLLTESNLFHASFTHAQTGEPYLVLDRAS